MSGNLESLRLHNSGDGERDKNFSLQLRNLGLKKEDIAGLSMLDMGCGSGDLVRGIRENGITQKAYGVDFKPIIEETKKQSPDHIKNFFAVNFAKKDIKLPEELKDSKFNLVTAHGVLHPYPEEGSTDHLNNKLENMLNVITGDGEVRIYPAYPPERWKGALNRFNSESSSEKVIFEFRKLKEKDDPLDVNNKVLVIRKRQGVYKGRFQP